MKPARAGASTGLHASWDCIRSDRLKAGLRDWGLGAAFSVFGKRLIAKSSNPWKQCAFNALVHQDNHGPTFQEGIHQASIDSSFFSCVSLINPKTFLTGGGYL